MVVDFTGFDGAPDARHPLAGPLPAYLYDAQSVQRLPRTCCRGACSSSRGGSSTATRPSGSAATPVAPWWWANQKRFARAEVVRHLDPRDLNRQFPQPPLDLEAMRRASGATSLPLLEAHPETEFDIVWPPYSIVVWGDYVQRRQLDVTLAFKRYVFEATRSLPNVHVVDLQPRRDRHPRSRHLYRPLPLLAPPINEWLIDAACDDHHRVRADNVDALLDSLRAQALAFDPAALAELADGAARQRTGQAGVPTMSEQGICLKAHRVAAHGESARIPRGLCLAGAR